MDTFAALRGDETNQRWKVTATFVLQLGNGLTVSCVRLRAPHCGTSVYYSETEFNRLYRKLKP